MLDYASVAGTFFISRRQGRTTNAQSGAGGHLIYLKIDVCKCVLACRLLLCCISKRASHITLKSVSNLCTFSFCCFLCSGIKLPLALITFSILSLGSSCLCRFGFHSAVHRRKAALLQRSGPWQSVAAVCLPHPFTHRDSDCPLQNL